MHGLFVSFRLGGIGHNFVGPLSFSVHHRVLVVVVVVVVGDGCWVGCVLEKCAEQRTLSYSLE